MIGLSCSLDLTLDWAVSYSGFQVPERPQGRLLEITSCKLHPNQASKFRRVLSMKEITFLIAMKLGAERLQAGFLA